MITWKGTGVCGGIAIGTIRFCRQAKVQVGRRTVHDTEGERKRFEYARSSALSQIAGLYERALSEVGLEDARIFEVHQMMLADEEYINEVLRVIETQEVNAEYAVAVTADHFYELFASMDDEYMRARAADVRDISDRVLRSLSGAREEMRAECPGLIICADDLSPSETIQMDRSAVLAFVTRYGSPSSHTAILARTMNIPAVVGVGEMSGELDGAFAAVDGDAGMIYLDPDEDTLRKMVKKRGDQGAKKSRLLQLKGKENITLDGKRIRICANIGGPQDVEDARANDAGGIGLFRSEFLYLEREDYPDEETQLAAYRSVLSGMEGKPVVIRTLDIGADKQIGYLDLGREENPALGLRAVRLCLARPEIFRTQLRALYRASVYGDLAILFPMITSVEEVHRIKEIVREVKEELSRQQIPYSDSVQLGIMIETPAAAVISDRLAGEVDFFSVGTNDLIQYTLACDRQNSELAPFCDPHHEAVLRLIRMAADAAHRSGKWIGICGELGADLSLTEYWLDIGIDELSVSPSMVLPVREKVRTISLQR